MMLPTEFEALDTNCTTRGCKDYLELLEIQGLSKNNFSAKKTMTFFLHFIEKEDHPLIKIWLFHHLQRVLIGEAE